MNVVKGLTSFVVFLLTVALFFLVFVIIPSYFNDYCKKKFLTQFYNNWYFLFYGVSANSLYWGYKMYQNGDQENGGALLLIGVLTCIALFYKTIKKTDFLHGFLGSFYFILVFGIAAFMLSVGALIFIAAMITIFLMARPVFIVR